MWGGKISFFAHHCIGGQGKRHVPRAPFNVIERAINLMVSETITDYQYDEDAEKIVQKTVV